MSGKTKWEMGIEAGHLLLGTSAMISDIGEEFEALEDNSDFCTALDTVAMKCECCSWWCEPCELNEEGECRDCADCEDED